MPDFLHYNIMVSSNLKLHLNFKLKIILDSNSPTPITREQNVFIMESQVFAEAEHQYETFFGEEPLLMFMKNQYLAAFLLSLMYMASPSGMS